MQTAQTLSLAAGTEFARKLWGNKLCVICMLLCILHECNTLGCVLMTSPCSLNRCTTFCKIGKIMEIIFFETMTQLPHCANA